MTDGPDATTPHKGAQQTHDGPTGSASHAAAIAVGEGETKLFAALVGLLER